ncbi:MAG: hypothetical protein LBK06_09830 [Planctomycetaceae bacterium]|jgi:hypothetical protein|nr:hypothetical protein [Planctomycetaceae bacterium]
MAHQKGCAPRKENDFMTWVKTICRDCTEEAVAWQLDPVLLQQFIKLTATAESKFNINANKLTKNRVSVTEKNAAFKELKLFLSTFISSLIGNTNISDNKIKEMGLRPRRRSGHLPSSEPDEAPVLRVVVGQNHKLTVYVSSLQLGHPTHSVNPKKYFGFILQYKIDGENQWETVLSTKSRHLLLFSDAERGKYITLKAAWLNSRLQKGTWSENVKELIN